MVINVKNLESEFKEEYNGRLKDIDGCMGVLEELITENMKKKRSKVGLEEGEYVFNNHNFNLIYDAVLDLVSDEERESGFSQYRAMLDRIDEKLDRLTARDRKSIRKEEDKKDKDMVGPHNASRDYARPIYHISMGSIDPMGVA